MTTTRVYIVFYSGKPMDFQTISELSGVEPSHIEVKGEHQHNSFRYDLPASHGIYVERLFSKLRRTIKNSKQLGEYCKAHGIKVYVEVVIEGITDTYSVPSIHFDGMFISFLADLNNAEVDFDIYTEPWGKDDDSYKKPAIVLPSGVELYKI